MASRSGCVEPLVAIRANNRLATSLNGLEILLESPDRRDQTKYTLGDTLWTKFLTRVHANANSGIRRFDGRICNIPFQFGLLSNTFKCRSVKAMTLVTRLRQIVTVLGIVAVTGMVGRAVLGELRLTGDAETANPSPKTSKHSMTRSKPNFPICLH